MAGLGRGRGTGEALRPLLQGVQPPQGALGSPQAEDPPSPLPIPPSLGRGRGRRPLVSRLTTLHPQAAPLALGSQESDNAAAAEPAGMGRPKLLGLSTSSDRTTGTPSDAQKLLSPPKETGAYAVSEVSRGAHLTAVTHPQKSSSSDGSENSLDKVLGKLLISERPDSDDNENPPIVMTGSYVSSMEITTNYLNLKTQPGKGIFQYDVQFKPYIDPSITRFHLMKQLIEIIGDTASFDGTMLYVPVKLPEQVIIARATLPSDQTEIKVKLTFVKEVRIGHPLAIHVYNLLFRRIMGILGLTLHGRAFMDPSGAKSSPDNKLEVWPGFLIAAQEYEGGVVLCFNASQSVLQKQTVPELMIDLVNWTSDADSWKKEFINLMIGQQVQTTYNNEVYHVNDIDFDSSPTNTFPMRNGDLVSYIDFYKIYYDVDIIDKRQPLLKCKEAIRGQELSLIPELCYFSSEKDTMHAGFEVMKSSAQNTMISPSQRQVALLKFLKNMSESKEVSTLMHSWGLRLDYSNVTPNAQRVAPNSIHHCQNTKTKETINRDWTLGATSNPVLSAQNESVCTSSTYSDNNAHNSSNQRGNDREEKTTNIIVNYLPNSVTQEYIQSLFSSIGPVESCKLVRDRATGRCLGYGFVNYHSIEDAEKAVNRLNGLPLQHKTIKVSFARPSSEAVKWANVHVAGLPKNMDQEGLRTLFSPYGQVVTSRILSDNSTGLSKGVGFVRFDLRTEAERAIQALNGIIPKGLTEKITVRFADRPSSNIATALPPPAPHLDPQSAAGPIHHPTESLRDSPLACDLFENPMLPGIAMNGSGCCISIYPLAPDTEELVLWQLFGPFGAVQSVQIFKDLQANTCMGFGFVRMTNYQEALIAVQSLNGCYIGNNFVYMYLMME